MRCTTCRASLRPFRRDATDPTGAREFGHAEFGPNGEFAYAWCARFEDLSDAPTESGPDAGTTPEGWYCGGCDVETPHPGDTRVAELARSA